jgi:hypothetical protein
VHRAVIRKRASSIEGVSEHGSLGKDSRIPEAAGVTRSARSAAMPAYAPRPLHRIPQIDCHRSGHKARATVRATATNRHCDRGGTCRTSAENQKRSANHYYRYHSECKGLHRISHTVQLQQSVVSRNTGKVTPLLLSRAVERQLRLLSGPGIRVNFLITHFVFLLPRARFVIEGTRTIAEHALPCHPVYSAQHVKCAAPKSYSLAV